MVRLTVGVATEFGAVAMLVEGSWVGWLPARRFEVLSWRPA
jgi:hypothetical protein